MGGLDPRAEEVGVGSFLEDEGLGWYSLYPRRGVDSSRGLSEEGRSERLRPLEGLEEEEGLYRESY